MENQEGYNNLINSIILQAFKDYKWAKETLDRRPGDLLAQRMFADVILFCRSDWLTFLTDVDGDWLLKRMEIWANLD